MPTFVPATFAIVVASARITTTSGATMTLSGALEFGALRHVRETRLLSKEPDGE